MRVLLLTHRLPYAPNRGDRIRSHHLLRALARDHQVHVVSLVHDDEEEAAALQMRDVAASVSVARVQRWRNYGRAALSLAGSTPLTHLLLDAPGLRPLLTRHVEQRTADVVIAYCSGMARFALEPPLDRLPFILDMVDVDSKKWAALAECSGPLPRWIYRRESRLLARFESVAARRAAFTTVVNDREREALRSVAPAVDARVVANGIDVSAFASPHPPSAEPRVVFTGVLDYAPNEQGARWMAERVWPLVRAVRPDARLVFVGSSPTAAVRRLPEIDPSIEVTGTVPAVQPYLWSSAVAVVPLATARGLQNKALEAIAAGLPVVVTSVVHEGLPPLVRPSCAVADSPESFAAALLALLSCTPQERRAKADQAQLASLHWSAQLQPLLEMVSSLAPRVGGLCADRVPS